MIPPPPHHPQDLEKIGIVNRAGELFKANPNSYLSWLLYIVFVPFRSMINALYDFKSERRQFRSKFMLEKSLYPIPRLSSMGLYCYPICQESVNYRLALAKGICHLPLWRLNHVLLQLLTFHMARREFRVESEALCAPEKLVEQIFIYLDIFRNWFHDPNACISSYLEKY